MSKVIEIKDFEDERLDVYARLTENQLINREDPSKGMFIAESPLVIERAIAGGYEPVSFLVEKAHLETKAKNIIEQFPYIPVFTAEFDVLTNLTGFKLTRGMLCAMKRKPLSSIKEVVENKSRIAILENVVNPTNVGAIFRSAAALNIDAVILTKGCSNPLYRRASRVSMGTVFQIPWTFMEVDSSYIEEIHKLGFKTAAMALDENSVSIDNEDLNNEERLAIVLGTEGEGLMKQTIEESDYTVMIPMSHGVDSLNVAAASAVAFWQLGNRKKQIKNNNKNV